MGSSTNPSVPDAAFLAPGPAAQVPLPRPGRAAGRAKPPSTAAKSGAGAAAGTAPVTFGAMAARIERAVAELEATLAQLPAGEPEPSEAKALRAAVHRLVVVSGAARKTIPGLNTNTAGGK